jgi:hypothetical protein
VLAVIVGASTGIGGGRAHLGAWFATVAFLIGLARLGTAFLLKRWFALSRAGWMLAFRLGAIVASLFWGGSAAYATAQGFDSNAVLLLVTTAGLASGAILNFASDLALCRAYVFTLLTPVLVATALSGTPQGYGATGVIVAYLAFLLIQGAELNRDFFRSLDQVELLAARAAARDVSLERAQAARSAPTRPTWPRASFSRT